MCYYFSKTKRVVAARNAFDLDERDWTAHWDFNDNPKQDNTGEDTRTAVCQDTVKEQD